MGPWGYVLANHFADAQVVSTILYQGKPEYFAMIVTNPESGLNSVQDLIGPKGKGRTFAFGDKGSTSGYLIPLHYFMQQGIDPECARRPNFDHPCRLNIDQGWKPSPSGSACG
jgi:phosphonate transport system substrate-binding protein